MTSPRLAIFDVDGTLTRGPNIWQHLLEQAGVWHGAGEANLARFVGGEIDYDEFCRLDAGLLVGQRYDDLRRHAAGVPVFAGLDDVFGFLAARGFRIALLSSGLRVLTDVFAARYPVDAVLVNDLGQQDGSCTGEGIVAVPWHGKAGLTEALIAQFGAQTVVTFGDSGADVPVFERADVGVAVNATDARLLALAHVHVTGDDLSVCLPELAALLDGR